MTRITNTIVKCVFCISCLAFLQACGLSAEWIKEQELKAASMSDWELCEDINIEDWPPSWQRVGNNHIFIEELIKRGRPPLYCSEPSKTCVNNYGFEAGSAAHMECALKEGRLNFLTGQQR